MAQETQPITTIPPSLHGRVDHWNNLLWSVGSADIPPGEASIAGIGAATKLPWLPSARRVELLEYFCRDRVKAALAPELEDYLHTLNHNKPNYRLGTYFERLWSFAFRQHPDYELRHQNLPLRKDGKTLGELDFVVQHLPSRRCEHWEIAVKFYLQVARHHWVGPGLKDRLDIKLARMADHQLPLIRTPGVQSLLRDHGLQIDRQWALMPGRLFKPLNTLQQLSNHPFWWAPLSEFRALCQDQPPFASHEWLPLPKRAWLAPQGHLAGISAERLVETLRSTEFTQPLCIAAIDSSGEACRGFIVPNDWHRRAEAGLPP
ncbi:DUF1853 family protein [Microbulbifer sp. ZKSA006]|uniref:DUF1853 family protein n=1 Tax=Microbulbifer sp. ZKSA006 TaxID=3243390 RepID=UPI00403960D1